MGTSPIRVLHVDDDASLLELTDEFLKREDDHLVLETATSADEGLDQIGDRLPDCIVSDYDMPGKNGIEFLQAVRKTHPDLPFILFTAKGSEEVASDAIAAGVTDYLQKSRGSGQYELLANRIRNAVNARREAKRAEKQERFTTQALDALEDIFYVFNTDGSLRRWNRRLPEVTGYPEPELAEIQATELFPEDERELIAEAIETTLTDGECTVEADLLTAGGERHAYELTGARLTDRDGNTTGLVGIGRDLTDRRQQKRWFQALVEESKDNISVIDTDGVFQYQSPAIERVLGYEPEETIGDTVWEYVHPDDRERLESTLEEWVATPGPAGPVEYRARHADGSWRWMQANGNNQLHNPAVEGYIVNSRDITERKERERELEQIETVFGHAQDALFLVDVGEEFTAERVNPAWEELTGLTAEQARGQTAQDIFDQQAGELIEDKYHECVQRREPLRYKGTIRLNGEQRHFVAQLAPIIVDGTVEYIAGSTRDVTDRRERERKLEAQNDRLEEFASVVSHDLRNPLRTAGGRLELAQADCDSTHLDNIGDALDRMDALIEDLLTLARSGETVGSIEAVSLSSLIEKCWEMVSSENATLTVETAQTVSADRSRLQQLLENLFANAVEHGGEDVTVRVGELEKGFYVADDGVGIPNEEREDIFGAGYSTAEEGEGFGLRIVKQIVDAHGWDIRVTDSDDDGAQFEITGADTPEALA